jgi:hypothetical protein
MGTFQPVNLRPPKNGAAPPGRARTAMLKVKGALEGSSTHSPTRLGLRSMNETTSSAGAEGEGADFRTAARHGDLTAS